MMMTLTLPAMSSTSSPQCLCSSSPSSSFATRTKYGISQGQSSRVQAFLCSKSLKPVLSSSNLSFSPFLDGQSLRLASLYKNGTSVQKAALVLRVSAQAVDAGASDGYPEKIPQVDDAEVTKAAAAQRIKISIYFAVWWALNVVFNIYNKKVLNVFPFPWLTSTLSLAAGSAIMLLSWALRIVEPPQVDADFWKALAPVCSLFQLCFLPSLPSALSRRFSVELVQLQLQMWAHADWHTLWHLRKLFDPLITRGPRVKIFELFSCKMI